MIVMGAGTNHWFHSDQTYRAMLALVLFCGCQGVNGGGWAHYVGQEKVRPITGWQTLAFALDWTRPPRQQAATPFWYLATDQWRYETYGAEEFTSPAGTACSASGTWPTATRRPRGSAGCPPTRRFDRNPLDLADEAEAAGHRPGRTRRRRAEGGPAALRLRGPRRPGQLPPRADRCGGQPARLLEQGPRVLPQAPARRAGRRRPQRGVSARAAPGRRRLARRGARRQARPVHHDRLPDERLLHLLRRRPAGRDLVREARHLEHRPAPVRPPLQRGRSAALGGEDRLGHLQPDRASVLASWPRRTSARAPTSSRRRCCTTLRTSSPSPAARCATGARASASRSPARRCRS